MPDVTLPDLLSHTAEEDLTSRPRAGDLPAEPEPLTRDALLSPPRAAQTLRQMRASARGSEAWGAGLGALPATTPCRPPLPPGTVDLSLAGRGGWGGLQVDTRARQGDDLFMQRVRELFVDSLIVLLLAAGLAVWLDYATTWARTGVWAGPSAAALGYIAWRVLSRRPAN